MQNSETILDLNVTNVVLKYVTRIELQEGEYIIL